MIYKYVKKKEPYNDLSSGRVLYNAPGFTAFPVRLASEIAQRCFAILESMGSKGPFTIYDPCCGGAYLLTYLGFLHSNRLYKIIASDYTPRAIDIAKKNLSLLQIKGIKKRIDELNSLANTYCKSSHKEAGRSALNLLKLIKPSMEIVCFKADITQESDDPFKADIIIVDFPYGSLTQWNTIEADPLDAFFKNIISYLKLETSILVIVTDKSQKLMPSTFKRIEYFKIGKRQVSLFLAKPTTLNNS